MTGMTTGWKEEAGAGLLLAALGAAAMAEAASYPVGSASRMGPGLFPALLGGALVVLGAAVALKALAQKAVAAGAGGGLHGWAWRPLLLVTGSVLLFAAGIGPLGLALAGALTVAVASAGSREARPAEAVGFAAAMGLLALLLFVHGLGLPLKSWPL